MNQTKPKWRPKWMNLHEAVLQHDHKRIKELLEQGMDPNIRGNFGITALHWAVATGDIDAAKILLDHGADPNVGDRGGRTPLHWAVAAGFPDIVELLLERGADPHARDNIGNTPLHYAAEGHISETAEMFFELAPRFGIEYPYDPLDNIRILLEYGADPTARNNDGQTPIDIALKNEKDEIAWLLASRLPPEKRKELLMKSGKTPHISTPAESASTKRRNRKKKKIAA